MESMGRKFRELLASEPYVFTGGVYSPLDAQIAARVGMKAIYLSGYSALPLAFNYSSSFRWHEDAEPFTFAELGALGYKFIFITLYAAHAGMQAVWNAMEDLVRNEEQAQWALERLTKGHPTESHHVMAGVEHWKEVEKRYIPGTEERYRSSDGFGEERAAVGPARAAVGPARAA